MLIHINEIAEGLANGLQVKFPSYWEHRRRAAAERAVQKAAESRMPHLLCCAAPSALEID